MIDSKYLDALEACSRCNCGCCKDGCPVYGTMLEEQVSARGRNLIMRAYLKGTIGPDQRMVRAVYSCLLCRLDEENCGARLTNAEICEKVRAELVSKGIGPLPEHRPLVASLNNYGNPWLQPKSSRDRWIRKAGVIGRKGASTKRVYYPGCTFSLIPGMDSVPASFVRLLEIAGEEYSLLGKEELCCGSTALRIGETNLFKRLSTENAKSLSRFEEIVTSCSGCYKTLSHDYETHGVTPRVRHSVETLRDLVRDGRLEPHKIEARVTYHDPCHLGRYSGLYDAPREVIRSIPGVELVEMRNSRERSRCCGAGAGVKTANPAMALEMAKRRVREAVDSGAEILVSACPFCEQNLKEATDSLGSKIRVMDIAELLLTACG